jgi:hypothetical protein
MLNPNKIAPRAALAGLCAALFATFTLATVGVIGTTEENFKEPGTQPETLHTEIQPAVNCTYCHSNYDPATEPFYLWQTSMMAQAARDPMFHACLAVAEQDAPHVGDTCLRCHTPTGWLEGRSKPSNGSALKGKDFEGVTCNLCHRMVDPEYTEGASPPDDEAILARLESVPESPHNGTYVVDPIDRRRGPFDLGPKFYWHEWRQSPFHSKSQMCATCHDVSNPVFVRSGGPTPTPGDVYDLNAPGAQHPTHKKTDEFALERTFSEWSQSAFAVAPIDLGGRFGGNKTAVSTCQDCHMPDASGEACAPGYGAQYRDDLPLHSFRGANTWVLRGVRLLDQNHKLYKASEASELTEEQAEQGIAENIDFLTRASDMELTKNGGQLIVRIINQTGHKLPTGYTEGRRMWINVKFLDAKGNIVAERGAYNFDRATLDVSNTKIYEAELGPDDAVAAATGLPAEPSFHFALVNKVYKDNRIPPRGFTNANYAAVQAAPVGAEYADGQYWDDTKFEIPGRAASAKVLLYYQSTSREYIEFLLRENTTNNAGRAAYEAWIAGGKSAPVVMDEQTIHL